MSFDSRVRRRLMIRVRVYPRAGNDSLPLREGGLFVVGRSRPTGFWSLSLFRSRVVYEARICAQLVRFSLRHSLLFLSMESNLHRCLTRFN